MLRPHAAVTATPMLTLTALPAQLFLARAAVAAAAAAALRVRFRLLRLIVCVCIKFFCILLSLSCLIRLLLFGFYD